MTLGPIRPNGQSVPAIQSAIQSDLPPNPIPRPDPPLWSYSELAA